MVICIYDARLSDNVAIVPLKAICVSVVFIVIPVPGSCVQFEISNGPLNPLIII